MNKYIVLNYDMGTFEVHFSKKEAEHAINNLLNYVNLEDIEVYTAKKTEILEKTTTNYDYKIKD